MTREEKAKAYDEALEDMKVIYPNLKGDIKLAVEHAFPELQESEDERIRKKLIRLVQDAINKTGTCYTEEEGKPLIAYLEEQKEQKPAEWSKEKEKAIDNYADEIIKWEDAHKDWDRQVIRATAYHFFTLQPKQEWSEEDTHKTERLLYLIASNKGFNREHRDEALGIVKSLRPNRWKPSEEQMKTLERWLLDTEFNGGSRYVYHIFESLYNDLKKL